MDYNRMTDRQLHDFAVEIAERSISAEEIKKRVFEIGYPFQFFFAEKRPLERGFAVMFQGHERLIHVK